MRTRKNVFNFYDITLNIVTFRWKIQRFSNKTWLCL